MPTEKHVIVDTNILFSALLDDETQFTRILLTSAHPFCVCESILVELFKHKERIVQYSKLPEDDVARLLYTLMRRVTLHKEALIEQSIRRKAAALCAGIDPSDAPQVALTIALDGLLWTGDGKLKDGLRKRGCDFFFEPGQ